MDPFILLYLDALAERDAFLCRDYADMQVALYAQYEPSKLMEFLKSNSNYDPRKGISVCEKFSDTCLKELVYLLGKVGQSQQALKLIINKLDDAELAVEFAMKQNDHDLWEDLLNHSAQDARYTRVLLECGNSNIDPVNILKRIPQKSNIPGLKETLEKIFRDKILLESLDSHALSVVATVARNFAAESRASRQEGIAIDPEDAFEQDADIQINWADAVVIKPENGNGPVFQVVRSSWDGYGLRSKNEREHEPSATVSIGSKIRHLAWILRNINLGSGTKTN